MMHSTFLHHKNNWLSIIDLRVRLWMDGEPNAHIEGNIAFCDPDVQVQSPGD